MLVAWQKGHEVSHDWSPNLKLLMWLRELNTRGANQNEPTRMREIRETPQMTEKEDKRDEMKELEFLYRLKE